VNEIALRLNLTAERVQEIRSSSRQPISLETPLGNEDSAGTLGDLIADRSVKSPEDLAARSMLRRHMDDAMQVLSPRERQVFDLVVRGKINKQIAHTLGTTERTIKAHRHGLMEKMQVRSLAELVSLAERIGVLDSSASDEGGTV